MTLQEMAAFSALVSARWPRHPRDASWAKAWHSAFESYTLDEAVRSLDSLEPQGSSPEGHELLAALREGGVNEDSLLADVLHALRSRGSLRPMLRGEWRSEAIAEAVEVWGGWTALCYDHDCLVDPAARAQFRGTLKAKLAERRTAGLPLLNPAAPERLALPAPPVFVEPESSGEFVPMPAEAKQAIEALTMREMPR